ncbi:hypothetical protein [Streptomyces sp. NBC_00582]|uniref:hypothetical protein n=1 Tax=Streptomyces sp. NBC_00582 TaxID=2975783 RepID=UPI002E81B40B|nr:hypothetical protein [Streptomyces sp. NBC_00582]WUB64429.1 hypothetical protein OG852_30575 [Streptomyces sp. NBC_00582]
MVTKEPEEPEARREGRGLLVLEVVFVLVVVVGLSLWSVPAAVMLGGVLGVLACERAMADRRAAGGQDGAQAGGEQP